MILLSYVPFIVLDLYYSQAETSCCHHQIQNTSIKFDLARWLLIKGSTELVVVLFPLLLQFSDRCCETLPLWYASYLILYSFFELAWLIVGTIMFCGYLSPNRHCEIRFDIFMWFDIICGYVRLFALNCIDRKSDLEALTKRLRKNRR